CAKTGGVFDYW
nr:immunoglobulin heavy chain junction region [Macaca mulatta]MOW89802.1 immunoglobulin heavy chain junction region [Macaca mulatta]